MSLFDYIRHVPMQLIPNFKHISHKFYFWIIFVSLFSLGCFQKRYDYKYYINIENNTNDTLVFFRDHVRFNQSDSFMLDNIFTVLPSDTLYHYDSRFGIIQINEKTNPVVHFFSEQDIWDTIQIFRNDTLKCEWVAPAYDGELDDHNFFNYNAWKTWLINDEEGVIMFTIYPEDLKLNNK